MQHYVVSLVIRCRFWAWGVMTEMGLNMLLKLWSFFVPEVQANKLIINIYTSILLELGLETQNLCWVLSPLPQGPFPGSRPHRPTWWRVECRPTLSCRGSTREFYTASATVTGPRELRWAWDFRRVYSRTVISQNWTSLPLLTLTNSPSSHAECVLFLF